MSTPTHQNLTGLTLYSNTLRSRIIPEFALDVDRSLGRSRYFQLELAGENFSNWTLANSVLLRGNWIDGPVSWGSDDPDIGARVVTPFSNRKVQVRVAMRDAELFSLSFRCVQQPHYAQCGRVGISCAGAWGAHYSEIPCASDAGCAVFGYCGGVGAVCGNSSGGNERVCTTPTGPEPGPLCGWF